MAEQKYDGDTALQDQPMDMDFEMQNTLNEIIGRTDNVCNSDDKETAPGLTSNTPIEDNSELTPSDAPNTTATGRPSPDRIEANTSPDTGAPADTDTYWDKEDLQEGSEFV